MSAPVRDRQDKQSPPWGDQRQPASAAAPATASGTAPVAGSDQPSHSRWLAVVSHTDPRYGGLSTAVPRLGLSLAGRGHEVALAAFCAPDELYRPEGYTEAQMSFWPTSRRLWIESPALRRRFADLVRAADGVHVHGLWEMSTAVASRRARREGRPYVLSAHGMLEPWALANKGLKKKIYASLLERAHVREATCLHALTAAEADQYRGFGARGPIAVVPNAVEIPASRSAELFLSAFPDLQGRRLVLFLGRLHPKKGLDLLAGAWLRIGREYPEAVLVLAGPDSEGTRAKLDVLLGSEMAAGRVVFAGMLSGPMKWSALAAAECFVLPSFSEGLSMSVLEAMGAGVPVLLTHACHMPEVSQAQAGWEIDARVEPLIELLQFILSRSPEANRETGRRGAQLIAERYGPAKVAEQMAALYEFALHGRRSGGLVIRMRADDEDGR